MKSDYKMWQAMHSGQSGNVCFLFFSYQYKGLQLKCLIEFIFGNILFLEDVIKINLVVRGNELLNPVLGLNKKVSKCANNKVYKQCP